MKVLSDRLWLGEAKKTPSTESEASWLFPLSCVPMSTVMHGTFSRAHLCTVRNVARQCPCPACRLWSSAGTGRRRSPHQNHTPAPPLTDNEREWHHTNELSADDANCGLQSWHFLNKHSPLSYFSHHNQAKGTHNGPGRSPQHKKLQNYRLNLHRMLGPQDLWRKW